MSPVIQRRRVRLALLALAATAAAGCTTFSDNDAVARVGDQELSTDEFESLTEQLLAVQQLDAPADGERVDGELARSAVTNWLAVRLAEQAGVLDRYANGTDDLGIACLFVITTPDVTSAQAVADELAGGADWFELSDRSVAEFGGIPGGGRINCQPVDTFGAEIAAQLATIGDDNPVIVVDGQPAAVVRVQQPDELFGIEFLSALQGTDPDLVSDIIIAGDTADVYIDPRIGEFDSLRLAVDPVQ